MRSGPLSQPVPNSRVSPQGCSPSLFSGNLRVTGAPSARQATSVTGPDHSVGFEYWKCRKFSRQKSAPSAGSRGAGGRGFGFPLRPARPIFSAKLEESPMPAPEREALSIDVVSDVVCPWCFIGKRRLEKAIALKPEIALAVRYRPYFLNPWVPRAGISRTEYLTTKFGSVDRYRATAQRVVLAARQDGLEYNLDLIARQPNTLDCHRLIRWSGESGDPARMKQRLMELYFTEGADLSEHAVLVA